MNLAAYGVNECNRLFSTVNSVSVIILVTTCVDAGHFENRMRNVKVAIKTSLLCDLTYFLW